MELSNIELIVFLLLSTVIIFISKRTIFNLKSHGFYRLLNWECILLLAVNNYKYWFLNPLSFSKIISWFLLFSGLLILFPAVKMLRLLGKPRSDERNELYRFEKTTNLIVTGIFKYIRHPMYSSLLFLAWGIFFKNTSIFLLLIALLSTVFIFITAKMEEKEDIEYFGKSYKDYMKYSKMFIPYIW